LRSLEPDLRSGDTPQRWRRQNPNVLFCCRSIHGCVAFSAAFFALRFASNIQSIVLKKSADEEAVEHFAFGAGLFFALFAILLLFATAGAG